MTAMLGRRRPAVTRWWLAAVLAAAVYGFHYGGLRGIFWLPFSLAVLVVVGYIVIAAISALGPSE
jgi:hypothetical protein